SYDVVDVPARSDRENPPAWRTPQARPGRPARAPDCRAGGPRHRRASEIHSRGAWFRADSWAFRGHQAAAILFSAAAGPDDWIFDRRAAGPDQPGRQDWAGVRPRAGAHYATHAADLHDNSRRA